MAEIDPPQEPTREPSTDRRYRGRPQLRPDDETRGIIYEAARHEFAGSGYGVVGGMPGNVLLAFGL